MFSRFVQARHESDPAFVGRAERALRFVDVLEADGTDWFWETDADGSLTYLSDRFAEKLGIDRGGSACSSITQLIESDLRDGGSSRSFCFHLSKKLAFRNVAVRAVGHEDSEAWSISGRPRFDSRGAFAGFEGSGSDLTERRQSQAAITRLAYSDALTGLANRERMRITLENLLSSRQSGFQPTALLLLDLDRFKIVNDTLGHQTGDELLRQVAQRIRREVGASGIVGRLGGDEFQVILANDDVRKDVELIAANVIHSLSQPYFIANSPIAVGCSVGIAISPEHGRTVEEVVRNADLALYAAKDGGRGVHRTYSMDMLSKATGRKQLEDDLRQALRNGELHVAYQPVVSTGTARVVGYEALVRWEHPVRGSVSPADFIPVAEESGLIAGIGEWMLRTAVADCARWPSDIRVAVNVSPIQFANPDLPVLVADALRASALDPNRLELEITESVFLAEDGSTDRMFSALKGLGVRLALDDFGTGYSSLGYLKTAPFDKIKIDQGFVRGATMPGNRNAAIIRAIVTLANALGMETTAEGVEQQDEIPFVRDLGCTHIQGYVYGRPERIERVLQFLADYGEPAKAIGHRVSRPTREKVLRKAQLIIDGRRADIMVRNVSSDGAMVEGVSISDAHPGAEVIVELPTGERWFGIIRWIEQGRAGLSFYRGVEA